MYLPTRLTRLEQYREQDRNARIRESNDKEFARALGGSINQEEEPTVPDYDEEFEDDRDQQIEALKAENAKLSAAVPKQPEKTREQIAAELAKLERDEMLAEDPASRTKRIEDLAASASADHFLQLMAEQGLVDSPIVRTSAEVVAGSGAKRGTRFDNYKAYANDDQ